LKCLSADYFDDRHFLRDIGSIRFLDFSNLNNNLAEFLLEMGFNDDEVRRCRVSEPINSNALTKEHRDSLWTPLAVQYVAQNDQYLFAMLRALGFGPWRLPLDVCFDTPVRLDDFYPLGSSKPI
jgi:hypothetical protein